MNTHEGPGWFASLYDRWLGEADENKVAIEKLAKSEFSRAWESPDVNDKVAVLKFAARLRLRDAVTLAWEGISDRKRAIREQAIETLLILSSSVTKQPDPTDIERLWAYAFDSSNRRRNLALIALDIFHALRGDPRLMDLADDADDNIASLARRWL